MANDAKGGDDVERQPHNTAHNTSNKKENLNTRILLYSHHGFNIVLLFVKSDCCYPTSLWYNLSVDLTNNHTLNEESLA